MYIVIVDSSQIFPLYMRVVLSIVFDVFVLQSLHDAFQVGLFGTFEHFLWQCLHRDISVVKIDANMLILHLKVTAHSWVSHYFFIVLLTRVLQLIAIEHRVLSDVL